MTADNVSTAHKITLMRMQVRAAVAAMCISGALTIPVMADNVYDRCMGTSDGTNASWSACGSEYLDRLDADLNEAWQSVFPELSSEGQTQLRTEQRAWNAFKEGSCLYLANGDYGREGQVLHYPLCRGQIIEQRIGYLNNLTEFVR